MTLTGIPSTRELNRNSQVPAQISGPISAFFGLFDLDNCQFELRHDLLKYPNSQREGPPNVVFILSAWHNVTSGSSVNVFSHESQDESPSFAPYYTPSETKGRWTLDSGHHNDVLHRYQGVPKTARGL